MNINLKKRVSRFLSFAKQTLSQIPAPRKWTALPQVFNRKEKALFFFFFLLFAGSSLFLLRSLYFQKTHLVPAKGGGFREGVLTQPRFINPVLASSNTDQDLVNLTFSGLMKYEKNGDISRDLAEKVTPKKKGTVYEVTLKDNLFWSDGKKITAEDVVFTVKTIQDPAYKSPRQTNWMGVEMEMPSQRKVRFILKKPYYSFKERLTLKPVPKHIFKNVPPEEFALSSFNLGKAVSSGPFKVKEVTQTESGAIRSLTLEPNKFYYRHLPYLKKFSFTVVNSEKKLKRALKRRKIDGMLVSDLSAKETKGKGLTAHTAFSPRYFALFFNPRKNKLLEKKEVRKGISFLIDRERIVKEAISGRGRKTKSPILSFLFGFEPPGQKKKDPEVLLKKAGLVKKEGRWIEPKEPEFAFNSRMERGDESSQVRALQKCLSRFSDIYPEGKVTGYFGPKTEKAVIRFQEKYKKEILAPWNLEQGTGVVSKTTRKKLNKVCNRGQKVPSVKFTLTTVDQPFLVKTAEIIKKNWEEAGLEVEIEKHQFAELSRERIKTRNYEVLLFGEMLGLIPDPYPFWHSSKRKDPGLNLAFYKSEEADRYLEKARSAESEKKFRQNLLRFQKEFLTDQPAVILFSPQTFYLVNSKVKGINLKVLPAPSQRFQGAENWYVTTKRAFK